MPWPSIMLYARLTPCTLACRSQLDLMKAYLVFFPNWRASCRHCKRDKHNFKCSNQRLMRCAWSRGWGYRTVAAGGVAWRCAWSRGWGYRTVAAGGVAWKKGCPCNIPQGVGLGRSVLTLAPPLPLSLYPSVASPLPLPLHPSQ